MTGRIIVLVLSVIAIVMADDYTQTQHTPATANKITVKWRVLSNGVVVTNIPVVVSYSTNLIVWIPILTNSGSGTTNFNSTEPQLFFRAGPIN